MRKFWNDYGRDLAIAYTIMAAATAALWLYIDLILLGAL